MKRKIIKIDEEKCIGCGLCVSACHEGAIGMVAGKAKLLREDYCDGLGDCLPVCPVEAIAFEERDVEEPTVPTTSGLRQWPIQIKLAPLNAPQFNNAHLLVAADCTAFAYKNFHGDLMKDNVTLIGCPKLDQVDYADKLTAILKANNIQSIKIARMEVPCCGGIEAAVKMAVKNSGKQIPVQTVTIAINGAIIE